MRPYFSEWFGNCSSVHSLGLQARDALAEARERFAAFIHAESADEIIFTSGGTESANLAIKGVAYASQRRGNHIIVSETEHPAVLKSVEFLESQGFSCTRIPVDSQGFVRAEAVRDAITEKTILISVHHANHDIGTIEPIRAIADVAQERGIPLFVDAIASGGWCPIDVQALGATLLSLSPHRFYGPKGAGVLYRNRSARLQGIIQGGVQESGRRAGTENVPAVVGAGVAAKIADRELNSRMAHCANLQLALWNGLNSRLPEIRLVGPDLGGSRLPHTLNVCFAGTEGEGIALSCDLKGIAISSGPSCINKSAKISHVLTAVGVEQSLAKGSVMMSVGKDNTKEEIEHAVEVITKVVVHHRELSPTWKA